MNPMPFATSRWVSPVLAALFFPQSLAQDIAHETSLSALHIETFQYADVRDDDGEPIYRQNGTNYERIVTKRAGTGTGFLCALSNLTCIVTARHVVNVPARSHVRFLIQRQNSKEISAFVDTNYANTGICWIEDSLSDLAIFPFPIVSYTNLHYRIIPDALFATSSNFPPAGKAAMIHGFPMGFGKSEKGLVPIMTQTRLASQPAIWSVHSEKRPFFLLGQSLAQGYSGAPVFWDTASKTPGIVSFDGPPLFLGIVQQTSTDQTGGKNSLCCPAEALIGICTNSTFLSIRNKLLQEASSPK
ncbi:MAG: trypsin-like peptidase domain-containing protein [Verrucomicrobia bacterium]|nr:trypsin-like peptidase domain-containing protein [Verrucomicrobiota bacterium]